RRSTGALAFVALERRPAMRLRVFAALRAKITSSPQSLVPFLVGASQGSILSILAESHDELPPYHSITSSARGSRVGGISRPSALAVDRLMTSSNFVGCSTGISAGFVPRRILSTKSAARRYRSRKFGP